MKNILSIFLIFVLFVLTNNVHAGLNGIKYEIEITATKKNLCPDFHKLKDLFQDVLKANNLSEYVNNDFFDAKVVCGRGKDVMKIIKAKGTVNSNLYLGLNNGFIPLEGKSTLEVNVIAKRLNKFLNADGGVASELLKKLAATYYPYTSEAQFKILITIEQVSYEDKCFAAKYVKKALCGAPIDPETVTQKDCLTCDVGETCKNSNDCASSICSGNKCSEFHVDVDDAGWNSAQATTIGAAAGLATIVGLVFML